MFRRVLILIFCLCLLVGSSTLLFAVEFDNQVNTGEIQQIAPYMNYISDGFCLISNMQNGVVKIDCTVNGYKGVTTTIKATVSLQQNKNGVWQTIRKFEENKNSHQLAVSKQVSVQKGYSYRVTTLVRAYSGDRFEVKVIRSNEIRF